MIRFRQFLALEAKYPGEIRFVNNHTDSYSGQDNFTLSAYDGDKYLGRIDYVVYGKEIIINWIESAAKRQGIGTALAQELQKMYPKQEIGWTATTDEGGEFLKRLPREFTPNQQYHWLQRELIGLRKRFDKLQQMYDMASSKEGQELETALAKMKPFHQVYEYLNDRIYELEKSIESLPQGSWKINLEK